MNPITSSLNWKYQKNKHLIEALVLRNAPEFVYKFNPAPLENEIPIFTFHSAFPDSFEEQCIFLAENGYQTLSADQFLHILTSPGYSVKKSVLITFDDGLKHVWTVAYPLLKKYGLKATCFLIPGCIPENDEEVRPTLEDYWENRSSLEEIVHLGHGHSALSTWAEIKVMHESGVIDFQSHTMYHSLVYTSERIFDFLHPEYNTHFYGNIHVPLYSSNGEDVVSRTPQLGMPIYCSKPRMSAQHRFFDDERLRRHCIQTVENGGGENFFKRQNWRGTLQKVVRRFRESETLNERYETVEERQKAVLEELLQSRQVLEERLPGKRVVHLCYPWYEAADFAIEAASKAGFKASYFGHLKGRPTNRPGDDLFRVVRIEDVFLLRLPGAGRKRIIDMFREIYELRTAPEVLGFTTKQ